MNDFFLLQDIAPTSVPSRTRLSSWPKASVSATSSIPNQPTKNEVHTLSNVLYMYCTSVRVNRQVDVHICSRVS